MAKLTLAAVGNIATSASTLNANFDAIEVAMENTLSRDGTVPNVMNANLDLNSNRILNLPYPDSDHEPLRKVDALDLVSVDLDEFYETVDEATEEITNSVEIARQWAELPYGDTVSGTPGGRSSLHYSVVSQQYAAEAASTAALVGAIVYDFGLLSDDITTEEDWGTL